MEKCSKGCVVEPEVIGWRTRAAKHGFLNNVHGSMDNQQSSASTIPPPSNPEGARFEQRAGKKRKPRRDYYGFACCSLSALDFEPSVLASIVCAGGSFSFDGKTGKTLG